MIHYVESEHICRSRILLVYFNEKSPNNCGVCDVCIQKNKKGLSNFEFDFIKELLIKSFSVKTNIRITELVEGVKPQFEDTDKTIAVLRFLIEEGIFDIEVDTISLNTRKD